MNRRLLVGGALGGLAMPILLRSGDIAAKRNAISRGLVIPGIESCLYSRAEPRRKPGAAIPWLDAWLIETSDDEAIDAIPAAFATAYGDAVAGSTSRHLADIADADIDTYGDAPWASQGSYIDPDTGADLASWAAIHVRHGDAVITICAESTGDSLTDLETVVTSILGRKQTTPTNLLPASSDLPDGMRLVERAIVMQIG